MRRVNRRRTALRQGFTLVEVMIVVLIISLLLEIAVPQWIRARENAQSKTCIASLKEIGDAKEMFAHEYNVPDGGSVDMTDIWPDYIKGNAPPACPAGGTYVINDVGTDPECSIGAGLFPHWL